MFGVGTKTALPPGGETTLDLEVLTAAAPGLAHIQVWENNGNAAQVDASFVDPLVQVGTKPQVISASLGLCEPYMYQGFHAAGINSLERDLELAASTGITVDASSGDSGSADCPSNNGSPQDALAVNYPASSPFVTGVGGTNFLLNANNTISDEIVWNDTTVQLGAGGGGLSDLFNRPSYQDGVVGVNQRAVPDISMLADSYPGYAIYCTAGPPDCGQKGPWTEVGGTSAAAPLFAGGAALVDQYLNHEGHEELGFVNPLLYAIGKTASVANLVYNDVTAYGNDVGPYIPGGNGQLLGCCTAGPGFDDASGWGSIDLPNFALAAKAALPKFGDVSVHFVTPQRPVAAHELKVDVHCTQPCLGIVEAGIEVGNKVIGSLESKLVRISHKGTKVAVVKFPVGIESKLRNALAHHKRITIRMLGAAVDSRGNIAKVTAVRSLTVTSSAPRPGCPSAPACDHPCDAGAEATERQCHEVGFDDAGARVHLRRARARVRDRTHRRATRPGAGLATAVDRAPAGRRHGRARAVRGRRLDPRLARLRPLRPDREAVAVVRCERARADARDEVPLRERGDPDLDRRDRPVRRRHHDRGPRRARLRHRAGTLPDRRWTRFVAPITARAASVVPAALAGAAGGVVGLDTRPVTSSSIAAAHAATAGVPSSGPHTGTSSGCPGGQSAGISQDGPAGYTPNQYLTAYDFDPLHAAGITGQGEPVALIEIDGSEASDIVQFAQCFGLPVPELDPYGVGSISSPLSPGGESTLDLEVLDAAAPGLKRIESSKRARPRPTSCRR